MYKYISIYTIYTKNIYIFALWANFMIKKTRGHERSTQSYKVPGDQASLNALSSFVDVSSKNMTSDEGRTPVRLSNLLKDDVILEW